VRRSQRTSTVAETAGTAARSATAAATPVVVALAQAFAAVMWAFAVRAAVEIRLASERLWREATERRAQLGRPAQVDEPGPNAYSFALQQPLGRGRNVGPTASP